MALCGVTLGPFLDVAGLPAALLTDPGRPKKRQSPGKNRSRRPPGTPQRPEGCQLDPIRARSVSKWVPGWVPGCQNGSKISIFLLSFCYFSSFVFVFVVDFCDTISIGTVRCVLASFVFRRSANSHSIISSSRMSKARWRSSAQRF